ncbi:hypothetical protein ABZ297_05000 [Nonomuraea sp. NPDC005983]|uniref:hypothetical protein n=1 Tax=Nonomuraea sp. NPDC005983 TaxID=3155595 RepID=UPI0033AD0913
MIATLRYEFVMQIRRPSLWIVYGLVFAVLVATLSYWSLDLGLNDAHVPRRAMATAAELLVLLLPIVYGCMLADRPQRDRLLRVDSILDATPTGRTARLVGRYLGVCAATAVPFALAYFGRVLLYVVAEGKPSALGWATLFFLGSVLPGLLFVGALAFAGPLLVPPMVFRVLFVAYWFWGNLIPKDLLPTLSHTILTATGEYVRNAVAPRSLEYLPGDLEYADAPPAVLDFLRPEATPAVALLWVGLMVALTVALLSVVRLHASRSES